VGSAVNTKLVGAMGEAAAAEFLRKRKYRILAMNYRSRYGEIDIVAADRAYLAFVEVKLRRSRKFAEAFEYVDKRKQGKIRMTAESWLSENETMLQPRFDVIEVYLDQTDKISEINHIMNAF
jgi:putative endonuclease